MSENAETAKPIPSLSYTRGVKHKARDQNRPANEFNLAHWMALEDVIRV